MKYYTIVIAFTCISILIFNNQGYSQIDPDIILQENKKIPKSIISWFLAF